MKLNENVLTIEDFQVSKLEEEEALDYIKKILVGKAIAFYNECKYRARDKSKFYKLDFNDIRRSLKKTAHYRNTKTGDYIEYKSPPLTFFIRKDYSKGWMNLVAGFSHPTEPHEPPFPYDVRKIRKIGDPTVSESEGDDFEPDEYTISKQEEQEAFQAIKTRLVPTFVEKFNNFGLKGAYSHAHHLSVEQILRTLKRVNRPAPYEVHYMAHIPTKRSIKYNISFVIAKRIHNPNTWKTPKGQEKPLYIKLVVGYYDCEWKDFVFVSLGTLYENPGVSIDRIKKDKANLLSENTIIPKLTKEEIYRAFISIKKKCEDELGPDLGKYLRKTNDLPSIDSDWFSNTVYYEYKEKGKRIVFGIWKDDAGLWVDRFDKGSKSITYDWNVDDYFMSVIKENIKHYGFHISKEEEDIALQYIRNRALSDFPEKVRKHFKKSAHFHADKPYESDIIVYSAYVDGKFYGRRVEKDSSGLWIIISDTRSGAPAGYKMKVPLFENTEPQGNITKEEEAHGLIFIKRGLVPMSVKTGNDRIRGWGDSEWEQTSVEDVLKHLRKTNHVRREYVAGMTYGDYIEYSYNRPRKIPLRFWIKKEQSNNMNDPAGKLVLVAGYEHPIRTENFNYIVSFNSEGRPNTFQEGVKIPMLEIVNGEHLSKLEESYTIEYIKKILMPNDITHYNDRFNQVFGIHQYRYPNSSPSIKPTTLQEMTKLLKKVDAGEDYDNLGWVYYKAIGPDGFPTMTYYIVKERNGSISIQYSENTFHRTYEEFIRA